jgi:glycosyltransferase involved in cell wall biosynthesis
MTMATRPRVLFVGHTRYDLPLPPALAKKWDALEEQLDFLVLATEGSRVTSRDSRFELAKDLRPAALESFAFYASLPWRVRRAARRFRAQVVVAQSPYEGLAALQGLRSVTPRPKLFVEVHGDWRSAARLYGSGRRRLFAPLADKVALRSLRAADATRAISPYTARLAEEATGRPAVGVFPTYFDIEAFTERPAEPLPAESAALWIGALERVKNPEGLARAWHLVASELPAARLVIVGSGSLDHVARRLAADLPGRVELLPRLDPQQIAARLDAATVLVLPSLSEGFGRVIVEAFTRGRPVIASAVGAIPDMVVTDRNGLLVPPGDDEALAEAILRVLEDRKLAARLGEAALLDAEPLQWTPDAYAAAMRQAVDRVLQET